MTSTEVSGATPSSRKDRSAEYEELREGVTFWLNPQRTAQFGLHIARYVHGYQQANNGESPKWGQTLTDTGVVPKLPFPPPEDFNASERQKWRNIKFNALMEVCRKAGWIDFGKQPLRPGRRYLQFMAQQGQVTPRPGPRPR